MKTNCTVLCLKYFVTRSSVRKTNALQIYCSIPERILVFIKAKTSYKSCISKTLCMVPQTDIRYLNEAHGESKSWHIYIISHQIFACNCYVTKASDSIDSVDSHSFIKSPIQTLPLCFFLAKMA